MFFWTITKRNILEKIDMINFPATRDEYIAKNTITDEDGFEFEITKRIVEETKEFVWVRLYLNKDNPFDADMMQGDTVVIKYVPSGEVLNTDFYFYEKKSASSQIVDGETVQHFDEEDDKSILILCVELGYLKKISNTIPKLRTMFKQSGFYEYEYIPLTELEVSIQSTDNEGTVSTKIFDCIMNIRF